MRRYSDRFPQGALDAQHLVAVGFGRRGRRGPEYRHNQVLAEVQGIGQREPAARHGAVVDELAGQTGRQHRGQRARAVPEEPGAARPPPEPPDGPHRQGGAQQAAFERAGPEQQHPGDARQPGVSHAQIAGDPVPGRQQQRTSQGRGRPAPVGIPPIVAPRDGQDGKRRAQRRPGRRQPHLQHPAQGGEEQRIFQHHAIVRMPEDGLPQGQEQGLPGLVFGGVGGRGEHVHGLEEFPQRMRRVGQPSGGEGVRPQQVGEFVVDVRLRQAAGACQGQHEQRPGTGAQQGNEPAAAAGAVECQEHGAQAPGGRAGAARGGGVRVTRVFYGTWGDAPAPQRPSVAPGRARPVRGDGPRSGEILSRLSH